MRYWGLLLAAGLLGCAHSGTKVEPTDGEDFARFHHIGVPSFVDSHGQGALIADDLATALGAQLNNEPVNRKALEAVLSNYNLNSETGLGVEALEAIRKQVSADAIIFGQMAPNWSAVRITVVDAEMGTLVLRALVMPRDKKKFFTGPDEVVREILRVFAGLR